MTDLLRWGSAGFPDKQRSWSDAGRAQRLLRRHGGSVVLGSAAALGLGASVFLGIGYMRYERLALSQETAMRRVESANADLQDALGRMRDQLGSANQSLGLAQGRIAELRDETKRQLAVSEQAATSKTDRIGQLSSTLDQAQRALHLAEAQRVTLMARLSKAENDIADGHSRQQQAQVGISESQKKLQQLNADRERAIAERDQLRVQMKQLEQRLSLLQTRQPGHPATESPAAAAQPRPATPTSTGDAQSVAAAAPPPAAETPASARVAGVLVPTQPTTAHPTTAQPAVAAAAAPRAAPAVAVGRSGLAQFERVLASAGVDVPHLFAQYGMRTGEGGPFIPAPRGATAPDSSLTPEKLVALSRIVKALPVAAPLQNYEIGSGFGVRGDPINGRASYHTGLDFRAPYMSPVYATAPGVVTFAGYRDDYGKIVEIDHGHGITTRYAHLHRFTVSVGQHVAGHSQVGFLGSTGRATGPHVHYEVLVNGEPQDPTKFLGLARLVPLTQS